MFGQPHENAAAVFGSGLALHQANLGEAIDQADRALVLDEQPFGKEANRRIDVGWPTGNGQQELMLLWGDAPRPSHPLALGKKLPDGKAELS